MEAASKPVRRRWGGSEEHGQDVSRKVRRQGAERTHTKATGMAMFSHSVSITERPLGTTGSKALGLRELIIKVDNQQACQE